MNRKNSGGEKIFKIEDQLLAVLSWMHTVLLFSGFYLLLAAILNLEKRQGFKYLGNCLWLFLPAISSWFAIRKIKGFPGYLAVSAAVTAFLWIVSKNPMTILFSGMIFLIRCYPRVGRGKRRQEEFGDVEEKQIWEIPTILDQPRVPHWLIFTGCYLGIILVRGSYLLGTVLALLIVEIFICYAFHSIHSLKEFIHTHKRIANLPVASMQRMQRAILGITVVLLVLFVLPAVFYGKEPLTGLTKLKAVMNIEVPVEEEAQPMEVQADGGMQDMLETIRQEDSFQIPAWVEQLFEIITYILIGLMIVGAAAAVYLAFRHMMASFALGREEDEVILLDVQEAQSRRLARKIRRERDSSPDQAIRRAYKRTIRKYSGVTPDGWKTPRELEESAGLRKSGCGNGATIDYDETAGQDGKKLTAVRHSVETEYICENVQEMETDLERYHEIYEKARYSALHCQEAEKEEFLNLQKEWKKFFAVHNKEVKKTGK